MKFYTISYMKFGKTFEVYPRLFTKRKDAEEFCVFLRSSGHSNVKITICTLQCKHATEGTSDKMPLAIKNTQLPGIRERRITMKHFKAWIDELDHVSQERRLSRYDQLLLDAAEVQLLLGNLGAADDLISKIYDYNIVGTFNVLKEKED